MAKSLFGGNNGGNLQDKYRAQNDAAIKRERADELDGKINELSEAKRSAAWAEEVIIFHDETLPLNEDVSDLLVNLSLIERLKKEADAYIARQKEKEAEAVRVKQAEELAKKRAAEEKKLADAAAKAQAELNELKELDDTVLALSKASKNEYWIKDVKKLQKDISALTVIKRSKLKNLTLLQDLYDKADLVEKAIPVEKSVSKVLAKKAATKKWYAEVIDLYDETDASLKAFIGNYAELEKAARDAKTALKKIEDEEAAAKKKAAAAAKKAREEEKAKAAYEELLAQQKKRQTEQEIARLKARIKNAEKGDTINFGSYAPLGTEEKKPIEWIVCKTGNLVYLVTKHVIERHNVIAAINQGLLSNLTSDTYSDKEKASFFHWNSSAVREWLNDKFFKEAFSDAEKSLIGTCAYHATYTCRTKYKKVDSKVKSSVHVCLPCRINFGYRASLKKYKKVKALPEINKDELIVEKGLFNAGNVTYLLGDAGVDEAKFKGKRFNKYYVYVCDGKGKIRKFYLNEKPLEYVLAENNDDTSKNKADTSKNKADTSKNKADTSKNKDDAFQNAFDAFIDTFCATIKLARKFSALGIRPMIMLVLSK